jgi:hypothetical protein
MRKAGLTDQTLYRAASEMAEGLVDADLGGNVVKKRVALPGQGKRGGARTIVATNWGDRWFCTASARTSAPYIDQDELRLLQEVAKELLGFDDRRIAKALSAGEIAEVSHGNDEA